MKYHYRTGVQKTFWEKYRGLIWGAIVLFVTILILDAAVNHCKLFIEVMVWVWE